MDHPTIRVKRADGQVDSYKVNSIKVGVCRNGQISWGDEILTQHSASESEKERSPQPSADQAVE